MEEVQEILDQVGEVEEGSGGEAIPWEVVRQVDQLEKILHSSDEKQDGGGEEEGINRETEGEGDTEDKERNMKRRQGKQRLRRQRKVLERRGKKRRREWR